MVVDIVLLVMGVGVFLTPIIGYLLGNKERYLGYFTALIQLIALIYIYIYLFKGGSLSEQFYLFNSPVSSILVFDGLSLFFTTVFLIIGFISSIHSIGYMSHDRNLTIYYTLYLLMMLGLVGLSMAYDLFTFFVFWEAMAISSYVLVAFRYHLDEPVEAGMKYLIMSGVGSLLMLYAITLIYGVVGSLRLDYIIQYMSSFMSIGNYGLLMVPAAIISLLMVGFGIKAAYFPFWTWLPDAHPAAPSPISALLSGIVIKAGILGIMRFVLPVVSNSRYAASFGAPIYVLAILTMTIPNIMALMQDDIKRLLAYSSIVNIGFILIGLASYSYGSYYYGAASALSHVFSHALGKALGFLAVGGIIYSMETREIRKMFGLGRHRPLVALALTMALLSLAGMPPLPGFWSKWLLILGAIDSGLWWLAFFGVFNSVLAVLYYLWLIQRIFFAEPTDEVLSSGEVHPAIKVSLIVLMGFMIIIGLYPQFMYGLAFNASKALAPLLHV